MFFFGDGTLFFAGTLRTRVHNSFVAGVRNAGASLLGLVLFVEEYGPVLLIWGAILGVPVWLLWRRYARVRRVSF